MRYFLSKLPSMCGVLLAASVAVFFMLRLTPGDPAAVLAGPDATPQSVAAIRDQLGLGSPLPAQYFHWIGGVLTGNLGRSYILGRPIGTLIASAAPKTIELALAAMLIAIAAGLALGLASAAAPAAWLRVSGTSLTTLLFAIPPFVSGVLLILVFAITWGLLPAGGHAGLLPDPVNGLRYLLMPAVCLALPSAAVMARFLKASMLHVLGEEYIETATAKGAPRWHLIWRHALPNALPPVITVAVIQLGQMLGGAILVEAIFAWPGLGQLMIQAVQRRDYLVVQDLLLMSVAVFVVLQTLSDVLLARIDPRTKLEAR